MNYLDKIINDNIKDIISKTKGKVWVVPTGGGKTYAGIVKTISEFHKNHCDIKVINIISAPYKNLETTIISDLRKNGVCSIDRDRFTKSVITDSHITICENWQSLILEENYNKSGDYQSFIERINIFKQNGYSIVLFIDECHIFNINDAPKVMGFLNYLRPDTKFLYSATPPENIISSDLSVEQVPIDQVNQNIFVKDGIIVRGVEHETQRIVEAFNHLKNITRDYKKLGEKITPKSLFVLKSGKPSDEGLKRIQSVSKEFGYNQDNFYYLNGKNKNENTIEIDDLKKLDTEEFNHIKIIITQEAGLTGLSVKSIETGCSLRKLNKVYYTQYLGRFVRNFTEQTKKLPPNIFFLLEQPTENFSGFDTKIRNNQITLTSQEFKDKIFPISKHISTVEYKNTLEQIVDQKLSNLNIIKYGHHSIHDWKKNISYKDLLNKDEISKTIVDSTELKHETKRARVKEIFTDFHLNLNQFQFKLFRLVRQRFDTKDLTAEPIFNILSFDENLSNIKHFLEKCNNEYNSSINKIYSGEIEKQEISLPDELFTTKKEINNLCPANIYGGYVSYDNDGEKISHILMTRKGYKVFRNEGMISISYSKGGKYHLYYPDFVGFDPNGKLIARDRKQKTIMADQYDGLFEKHIAAIELGYDHGIITEDGHTLYFTDKMDNFKSFSESPENWTIIN